MDLEAGARTQAVSGLGMAVLHVVQADAVQLRAGGVAAQDAEAGAGLGQLPEQILILGGGQVAFHVREEDVLPALAAQGTGLQLAHVDLVLGQQGEHAGERTGLVRQGEEHGGLVRAGMAGHGRGARQLVQLSHGLGADDDEARPVAGLVLDAAGQDGKAGHVGQLAVADGRGLRIGGGHAGRGGGGLHGDEAGLGQMASVPSLGYFSPLHG